MSCNTSSIHVLYRITISCPATYHTFDLGLCNPSYFRDMQQKIILSSHAIKTHHMFRSYNIILSGCVRYHTSGSCNASYTSFEFGHATYHTFRSHNTFISYITSRIRVVQRITHSGRTTHHTFRLWNTFGLCNVSHRVEQHIRANAEVS